MWWLWAWHARFFRGQERHWHSRRLLLQAFMHDLSALASDETNFELALYAWLTATEVSGATHDEGRLRATGGLSVECRTSNERVYTCQKYIIRYYDNLSYFFFRFYASSVTVEAPNETRNPSGRYRKRLEVQGLRTPLLRLLSESHCWHSTKNP